jgi:hypothetical protein
MNTLSMAIFALRSQHPINRRTANVQSLRDLSGAEPLGPELPHLCLINGRLPAPVRTRRLGLGDSFELTLAPQVGFELGEHAEHVEKALAGRRAGVDRLLGGLQRRAGGPYGAVMEGKSSVNSNYVTRDNAKPECCLRFWNFNSDYRILDRSGSVLPENSLNPSCYAFRKAHRARIAFGHYLEAAEHQNNAARQHAKEHS